MQVKREHVKKVVVIRVISFPFIFFPLFGIPPLIYSCHSSQTIFETLRQGHCTIIVYHSAIVIKNFEKTTVKQFIVWQSSRIQDYNFTKIEFLHRYFFNFLMTGAEQLLRRNAFSKCLFFGTSFGGNLLLQQHILIEH